MTLEGSLRKHFISTKFSRKFKVEGKKLLSMQQLIGRLLHEAQLCVGVWRKQLRRSALLPFHWVSPGTSPGENVYLGVLNGLFQ